MSNIEKHPFEKKLFKRRSELIPPIVLQKINDHYLQRWAPGKEGSLEVGMGLDDTLAMWFVNDFNKPTRVTDILAQRVANVVKQGRVFRILDVGSSSYATLLTGLEAEKYDAPTKDKGFCVPVGIKKETEGLIDLLEKWGFKAERDFELIAVNGGDFAITEKPGLKLITCNIFDGIPHVNPNAVDLLLSFRTVYQSLGGLYLLEYFDQLLHSDKSDPGIGIVWPFEPGSNSIYLVDQNGKLLSLETLFNTQNQRVRYWHPGRHVHWTSGEGNKIHFPIKPFALLTFSPYLNSIIYQLDQSWIVKHPDKVVYHEEP